MVDHYAAIILLVWKSRMPDGGNIYPVSPLVHFLRKQVSLPVCASNKRGVMIAD